ncbi:sulfite exporter TauE/SafE family protein [Flavobacterium tyrosinilyticum]|uniref:sulfite exporter TauE/SafE family protein n=1 Tax=Flavobacterium tyrosinilyticum TaxID=1658740 RepID=UPI00202E09AE|nr:sulfite exporter TauE/SafE family protein [Flavobacterium tyrosinilyticum]MCM0667643.1 sulfite exporter TauE/SafE family protein [Flavobacterium tyrosinilyticum]
MENYLQYGLLLLATIVGGAVNAFAGGGGFIVFPSLVLNGVSSIRANAMTCVSMWFGNVASVKAFKNDIRIQSKDLKIVLLISGIGGLCGATVMVMTDPKLFKSLVPYFHLISWGTFAFSKPILAYFQKVASGSGHFQYSHGKILPLFLINFYGGYFNAGIGIMILTLFTLYGMKDLNEMNGLKVLMVTVNNGIAALCFIFSGLIDWKITLVLTIGGIIGGYYGAVFSRNMNQELVRKLIIVVGGIIAVYFFTM